MTAQQRLSEPLGDLSAGGIELLHLLFDDAVGETAGRAVGLYLGPFHLVESEQRLTAAADASIWAGRVAEDNVKIFHRFCDQ